MESHVPSDTCRSCSFVWFWIFAAFVIGFAAGYGISTYRAPDTAEISEQARVDFEEKERVSEHSVLGFVKSFEGDDLVIEARTVAGETAEYTFRVDADSKFVTFGTCGPVLSSDELSSSEVCEERTVPIAREEVGVEAQVTVTANQEIGDGTQTLYAAEVFKF